MPSLTSSWRAHHLTPTFSKWRERRPSHHGVGPRPLCHGRGASSSGCGSRRGGRGAASWPWPACQTWSCGGSCRPWASSQDPSPIPPGTSTATSCAACGAKSGCGRRPGREARSGCGRRPGCERRLRCAPAQPRPLCGRSLGSPRRPRARPTRPPGPAVI